MPQIRRANLPPALLQHLLDRTRLRNIPADQLGLLAAWLDTRPSVPQGRWFKRFSGMTVCGEGELVKTFLTADQSPTEKNLPEERWQVRGSGQRALITDWRQVARATPHSDQRPSAPSAA